MVKTPTSMTSQTPTMPGGSKKGRRGGRGYTHVYASIISITQQNSSAVSLQGYIGSRTKQKKRANNTKNMKKNVLNTLLER